MFKLNSKQGGFTLLEVMVVLFIVGLTVTIVSTRVNLPGKDASSVDLLIKQMNTQASHINIQSRHISRISGLFYVEHEEKRFFSIVELSSQYAWGHLDSGFTIDLPPSLSFTPPANHQNDSPLWLFTKDSSLIDEQDIGTLSSPNGQKAIKIQYGRFATN